MKKNRSLAFYVFMVFFFALSIYFLVQKGKDFEKNSTAVSISAVTPGKANADQSPMYKDAVVQRLQQSLPLLRSKRQASVSLAFTWWRSRERR